MYESDPQGEWSMRSIRVSPSHFPHNVQYEKLVGIFTFLGEQRLKLGYSIRMIQI